MHENLKELISRNEYDFLDFGASKGGSITLGLTKLGGRKGLGIDKSLEKLNQMKSRKYDCLCGDVTNLDIPDNSVDFVIISHLLEHLDNMTDAEKTIATALRVSKKFVYIQGPFFDADNYLFDNSLKLFWSDWTGHPLHFKTQDLLNILDKYKCKNFHLYTAKKIKNSLDHRIHPLTSPPNQHDYDSSVHPVKQNMNFKNNVYAEFFCLIDLLDGKIVLNPFHIKKCDIYLLQGKGLKARYYYPWFSQVFMTVKKIKQIIKKNIISRF